MLRDNYITIIIKDIKFSLGRDDERKYVDHRDGNTLNYQMNNLRIIFKLHNSQNKKSQKGSSSIYVGITFQKSNNKWA